MNYNQLNEVYEKLDKKAHEFCEIFHCTFGYYNGHYRKNQDGDYKIEYFPIPVLSIKGLCDIEIGLDQISITTKLSRDKAISYDYNKIKEYPFEVYGVENYLDDFYLSGDTIESMKDKILKSKEQAIFFSFSFPSDVKTITICEFINAIVKESFFY
ncbi:MAG: hypothetical protein K2N64_05615 [Anaeroplasmataceae bacterium]|nr:hypothetical protein [Anaeroplasmataceae bacterium]